MALPLGLLAAAALAAQTLPDDLPPEVAYAIEARLNAKEHTLAGRSTIRYRNRGPAALERIYLHLYPNTYRDRYSTAAREQAFYHDETIRRIPAAERGYLDVEHLAVDGRPVPFQVIDTLLELELPRPLAPGEETVLTLEWFEKVRRHVGGGGFRDRHYELTHWYPAVARRDRGGWQAEPAHDAGVFTGVFADFDVTLTVPVDHVVAATGELVEGDAGWGAARGRAARPGAAASEEPPEPRGEPVEYGPAGSRKRLRFRARGVNDFAWVSDPGYLCEEDASGPVAVRVLYRERSRGRWAGRVLERTRRALAWMAGSAGAYPWPQATVAEGLGPGAAGHPMLVVAGEAREEVLARGLAELWFPGALASDRVREAWLHQGMASWHARRYMTSRHGPAGLNPEDLDPYERRLRHTPARDREQLEHLVAARVGRDEPVATAAHLFRDRANRAPAVRAKAALFLDQLRHRLGAERFDRAFAEYVRAGLLRPVDGALLREVLEREGGLELGPLFRAWLHSTARADGALAGVRVREGRDGEARLEVEVERGPERATPLELLVRGRDGSERRLVLPGAAAVERVELAVAGPPALVWLDPDGVAVDRDRLDNRRPRAFEWVFGWPFQDYRPRDAYVVAWRPSLWTNDRDDLRGGVVLEGAQEGLLHRVKLAPSLGARQGRFDLLARYATPLVALGRTDLEVEALKAEGRRRLRARLVTDLSPRLERRPQTRFEVGFSSLEVTDLSYTRPQLYEPGTVNQLWFRYGGEYAGPGWRSQAWLQYQVAGQQLESDFSYNRLAAALAVEGRARSTRLKLRGFVGLSSDGDRLPREERFYLGGAGPTAELDHPGLRSRGSLLGELHYHLPGDGNFRAYSGQPLSARRLFTLNLEVERPLLGRERHERFVRVAGRPWVALFGDMGKAEGTGVPDLSNPLFGVGVGLRLERRLYGRDLHLRFDLPFFANRPGFEGDGRREQRGELRWLLSFSPAL